MGASRTGLGRGVVLAAARRALRARVRLLDEARLAADAWVVAPHPDDETLGCGGLILKKRALGGRVRVVFVSDGTASHARFMEAGLLKATRKAEALEACRQLGVEQVHFLDLPDGALARWVGEGARRLAELFGKEPACEVYTTFGDDGVPDHRAVYALTARALEGQARKAPIEYPVWAWRRWPWVPHEGRPGPREWARAWRDCVRFIVSFRWAVRLQGVREAKRRALECHKTQMARPAGEEGWPILADVSGGAFLDLFFQEFELFR